MAADATQRDPDLGLVIDILTELGLDNAEAGRWWRASRHPELGDMTPEEAWSLDEKPSVLRLLVAWYSDVLRAESHFSRNPALVLGVGAA